MSRRLVKHSSGGVSAGGSRDDWHVEQQLRGEDPPESGQHHPIDQEPRQNKRGRKKPV
jgi:hypothetical protein